MDDNEGTRPGISMLLDATGWYEVYTAPALHPYLLTDEAAEELASVRGQGEVAQERIDWLIQILETFRSQGLHATRAMILEEAENAKSNALAVEASPEANGLRPQNEAQREALEFATLSWKLASERTDESVASAWFRTAAAVKLAQAAGDATGWNEAAAVLLRPALAALPREPETSYYAECAFNLGLVLAKLGEHEAESERLEEALTAFADAMSVLSDPASRHDRASVQSNRGTVLMMLSERYAGVAVLGHALDAFDDALAVFDPTDDASRWTTVQLNRGVALARLAGKKGSKARLEDARSTLHAALERLSPDTDTENWAKAQMNFGAVLHMLGMQELGTAALELALEAYSHASSVFTEMAMPTLWAQARLGCSVVLDELGRRTAGTAPFEEALIACDDALTVLGPATDPMVWATAQMSRGNTLLTLSGQGTEEGTTRLEEALTAFDEASTVCTRTTAPTEWARIQVNRSNVLQSLGKVEAGTTRLEAALAALDDARAVFTPTDDTGMWALIQRNRGFALFEIGSRDDDLARIEMAVEAFEDAHALSMELPNIEVSLRSMVCLAYGLARLARWPEVFAVCTAALDLRDRHFGEAETTYQREKLLQLISGLGQLVAEAALHTGSYSKGLWMLESARMARLREALALDETRIAALGHSVAASFQSARARIARLRGELDTHHRNLEHGVDGRTSRAQQEIVSDLRQARADLKGILEGAGLGLPPQLDLADLLNIIPKGGALIVPVTTEDTGFAFVMPAGTSTLEERHIVKFDADDQSLRKTLVAWFDGYFTHCLQRTPSMMSAVEDVLTDQLIWLGEKIMGPILAELAAFGIVPAEPTAALAPHLLIMPVGDFAMVPLHAALCSDEHGCRRPVLESYAVSYTPSLDFAVQSQVRSAKTQALSFCALVNPTLQMEESKTCASILPELRYSEEVEGPTLARLFTDQAAATVPRMLYGGKANLANLEAALRAGTTYLHLACHGIYDWSDVTESGLYLANGDRLTIRHIANNLPGLVNCRLVGLSACETSISDVIDIPDEAAGLVNAFLAAGALGVMASLWMVSDAIAALFMVRLYQLMLPDRQPPGRSTLDLAQAARQATLWLRSLDKTAFNQEVARLRAAAASPRIQPSSPDPGDGSHYATATSAVGVRHASMAAKSGTDPRASKRKKRIAPSLRRDKKVGESLSAATATRQSWATTDDGLGTLHWAPFTPWGF